MYCGAREGVRVRVKVQSASLSAAGGALANENVQLETEAAIENRHLSSQK
jgi:uncharacterized protein (DUF342 family)